MIYSIAPSFVITFERVFLFIFVLVPRPLGAKGWSSICDCGSVWSKSLVRTIPTDKRNATCKIFDKLLRRK